MYLHNLTYTHTQKGQTTIFLGILAAVGAVVALIAPQWATHGRVGQNIPHILLLVLAPIPILIIGTVVVFSRLTICVADGNLMWWFGPGVWRKSVALAEIASAASVRNMWWYGYGIRLTPNGWLYNVAGLDAVEVTLASGRRFRLGTDEPDMLARAISSTHGPLLHSEA